MGLATLTADDGSTATDLVQKGDISSPQIMSGSDQRLGSTQPLFYQTGRSASRDTIEFQQTNITSLESAMAVRDQLRAMQGQRVVVNDQFGQTIECFFHSVKASAKVGCLKWLMTASVELQAMPSVPPSVTDLPI